MKEENGESNGLTIKLDREKRLKLLKWLAAGEADAEELRLMAGVGGMSEDEVLAEIERVAPCLCDVVCPIYKRLGLCKPEDGGKRYGDMSPD